MKAAGRGGNMSHGCSILANTPMAFHDDEDVHWSSGIFISQTKSFEFTLLSQQSRSRISQAVHNNSDVIRKAYTQKAIP